MEKTLLTLLVFVLFISCKKEEPVVNEPVVVVDQTKVESNMVGI